MKGYIANMNNKPIAAQIIPDKTHIAISLKFSFSVFILFSFNY